MEPRGLCHLAYLETLLPSVRLEGVRDLLEEHNRVKNVLVVVRKLRRRPGDLFTKTRYE